MPLMKCAGVLMATAVACLALAGAARATPQTSNDQRIAIGFKIAPVPLNLAGKSYSDVGLGSYLVNSLGGCNDCHTNPSYAAGGDPFAGQKKKINAAGYLGGGQDFKIAISPNLTPDKNGLPAGLTLVRFISTIRTGHDPDHPSRLLQVMPWPTYQDMDYGDLKAVYSFLTAIPSLPGNR